MSIRSFEVNNREWRRAAGYPRAAAGNRGDEKAAARGDVPGGWSPARLPDRTDCRPSRAGAARVRGDRARGSPRDSALAEAPWGEILRDDLVCLDALLRSPRIDPKARSQSVAAVWVGPGPAGSWRSTSGWFAAPPRAECTRLGDWQAAQGKSDPVLAPWWVARFRYTSTPRRSSPFALPRSFEFMVGTAGPLRAVAGGPGAPRHGPACLFPGPSARPSHGGDLRRARRRVHPARVGHDARALRQGAQASGPDSPGPHAGARADGRRSLPRPRRSRPGRLGAGDVPAPDHLAPGRRDDRLRPRSERIRLASRAHRGRRFHPQPRVEDPRQR